MNKSDLVKEILDNKRNELIWSLSLQEYTQEDIAYILKGVDRSSISRIIAKRPKNYKSPWVKRNEVWNLSATHTKTHKNKPRTSEGTFKHTMDQL